MAEKMGKNKVMLKVQPLESVSSGGEPASLTVDFKNADKSICVSSSIVHHDVYENAPLDNTPKGNSHWCVCFGCALC